MELIAQRCRNHSAREAVARCPGCSRYFCRECISEHEGRVLCASCLVQVFKTGAVPRARLASFVRIVLAFAGIVTAWIFFDLLGHILVKIPASFHEGTIWEKAAEEP